MLIGHTHRRLFSFGWKKGETPDANLFGRSIHSVKSQIGTFNLDALI